MHTFFTILLSLVLAVGCSHFAKKRGRNPTTWFIAGLFFGVFALIVLFILPVCKTKVILSNPELLLPQPPLTILEADHVGKLWYFIDEEKKQLGPMSFDALGKAWKDGKVREKTFVWNEAMENWRHFQEVIKPSSS